MTDLLATASFLDTLVLNRLPISPDSITKIGLILGVRSFSIEGCGLKQSNVAALISSFKNKPTSSIGIGRNKFKSGWADVYIV